MYYKKYIYNIIYIYIDNVDRKPARSYTGTLQQGAGLLANRSRRRQETMTCWNLVASPLVTAKARDDATNWYCAIPTVEKNDYIRVNKTTQHKHYLDFCSLTGFPHWTQHVCELGFGFTSLLSSYLI